MYIYNTKHNNMTQTVIYIKKENLFLLVTILQNKVGDLEVITEKEADALLEQDNVNYYSL